MVGGGRVRFRTGAMREAQRRQFALCKERRGLSRACAFLVPVGFLSTGQVATWLLFPQTLTAREKPCGVSVAEASTWPAMLCGRATLSIQSQYRTCVGDKAGWQALDTLCSLAPWLL